MVSNNFLRSSPLSFEFEVKVGVHQGSRHVLRRDDGHVLRKVFKGKRKRGRPKKTWNTQVEKESKSVGLEKKDASSEMESGS